jgi:hypothetical protein
VCDDQDLLSVKNRGSNPARRMHMDGHVSSCDDYIQSAGTTIKLGGGT